MNCRGSVRPRLLVVWILVGLLLAAIAAKEVRERSTIPEDVAEKTHGVDGSRMLLPLSSAELGAIEIGHAGTLHRFERDGTGNWFYHGVHTAAQAAHAHQTDPAQAQIIDKALAGLGRTRMERQLKLDMQSEPYGLTSPQMIIIVYALGNPLPMAQFAVGDIAPDGLSRYVLPVGGNYVVTIANYQIDNLLNLIQAVGGKTGQGTSGK